jgi:hypothetical protein
VAEARHRLLHKLPLAGTTALQAFELGDLEAGQHLLVHAAAGAVVTPSPTAAIELRAAAPDGYHMVLDLLGGSATPRAWMCCVPAASS